jgi:hypothetical protein
MPLALYDALLTLQTRYPILYCVLVLPVTILRLLGFHEKKVSGKTHKLTVVMFIFHTLFVLSGVFNALLYRLTRANFFQGQPRAGPPLPPPIRKDLSRTELGVATQIDRGYAIS